MKRVLIVTAIAWCLWGGGAASLLAFKAPLVPPLPDFDKRLERVAGRLSVLSPEQADAVEQVRQQVPSLNVSLDRLLAAPNHLASTLGFLTGGPAGAPSPSLALFPATDPHRALKAFLSDHPTLFGYGPEILNTAAIRRDDVAAHNGMRTTVWQQRLDGVWVYKAVLISRITRNGELVSLSSYLLRDIGFAADVGTPNRAQAVALPSVSARQAVVQAAQSLGAALTESQVLPASDQPPGPDQEQRLKAEPVLAGEVIAKLTWVPMGPDELRLCWEIFLNSRARLVEKYDCLVDALTGEVVVRHCLTSFFSDATFNVYTSDSPSPFSPGLPTPLLNQPPLIPRVLVTTNALDTNASPLGWISDNGTNLQGNNVIAAMDWLARDQPDLPLVSSSNRVFDFPLDLTTQPTNYGPASAVQLFYQVNWYHDKLYELGFTEAAGNFQEFNFGRGGFGGDAIQAYTQMGVLTNDANLRNNAYFSTMPDGYPGSVHMFVFDGPQPNRDGALDAEVLLHEMTHGTSQRLVGGGVMMTELQPNGMGEGWSDFYALSLLSEPADNLDGNYANGGYATFMFLSNNIANYYFGIRRYPYSTDMTKNPLTFKDIDPTQADPHVGVPMNPIYFGMIPFFADEVHFQGEVWCATLWEARVNLVRKYGWTNGNQMILQLVTDGMKLAPANPTYIEARNAILQADLVDNGGANALELWTAFAKRGLGSSAVAPPNDTTVGVIEAFDMPGVGLFQVSASDLDTGNANGAIDPNECNELTIVLVNNGDALASAIHATLTSLDTNVIVAQADSPYADLVPGGLGTNLVPFRIFTKPGLVCGQPIQLALQVRSAQEARTLRVRLNTGLIGPAYRFDSVQTVNIPDGYMPGALVPITVAGFSNLVGQVTVSLQINHTYDWDLGIQLIGPDGTAAILANGNGRNGTNFGNACFPDTERTTFDDKAARPISSGVAPFVGAYRPLQPLASFNLKAGAAVNGTWYLRVVDRLAVFTGQLNCWSLNLFPLSCSPAYGECPTDLAVYSSASAVRPVAGSNWTYRVTVANEGQNIARNVMLTNLLPAGVAYLTNSLGCGVNAGTVICSLGNLAPGYAANIDFTVRPQAEGFITNAAIATTETLEWVLTNNVSVLTARIYPAAPFIVTAGAKIIGESFTPPTGAIENGETVTVNLFLQNIGVLNTTNLVATLLSGNGVLNPSAAQRYGALAANGVAVAKAFSFTADGTNGGAITAVLQLHDGTKSLGTVSFVFGLSADVVFPSPGGINIPDHGPAALYPAPMFVSGLFGQVGTVRVSLLGLTHHFPDDLNVLLVAPNGQAVVLMANAGGGGALQNVDLAFADGADPLPDETRIVSGTYAPTAYPPVVLTNPAPRGPYAAQLSAFSGLDPNGVWSLYIFDDTPGDEGRLARGWDLDIRVLDPVDPHADLMVIATNAPSPVMINSNVLYTVTVVNRGPDLATGVFLTNTLPASLVLDKPPLVTQGSCTVTNGKVICNLGSVTNQVTVFISGKITASGVNNLTSTATLNERDLNAANNTFIVVTPVIPMADLGLLLSSTPAPILRGARFVYTLTVTNAGPDDATNIVVTNLLPAEVTILGVNAGSGAATRVGRVVRGSWAQVPKFSQATLTVTNLAPDAVLLLTNLAAIITNTPLDLVLSNNTALLISPVVDPDEYIVPAGSQLLVEQPPATGGIEPGEQVTLNLGLRNIGVSNTTSLVATLRNTGGVTLGSGPVVYGALASGGDAVWGAFTLTASGAAGATILATLDLVDGANSLGTVSFPFTLGGAQRSFANNARIAIPDHTKAVPYPSVINVSGFAGAVGKVTVTLTGLTHTYPADIEALLVGPQGLAVVLMSDVGGGNAVANITLTIDDDAAQSLTNRAQLASGAFSPGNFPPSALFPTPAPAGPYANALSAFRGTKPNGLWSLYILDDYIGDVGSIQGGWSLTITTVGMINASVGNAVVSPASGEFGFNLSGQSGDTYMIQTSTDLVKWTDLTPFTLRDKAMRFTDPNAGAEPRLFYRAVKVQP